MIAWLDNSRVLSMFAVVFAHAASSVIARSAVGSESWIIANFYCSVGRWCVPVFIMISGALLLDPGRNESMRTFYKKRLSRILWPILFWSIFYSLWTYLNGAAAGNPPAATVLAKKLLIGNSYYHMWFIYMMLGLYVFTPLFRKITLHSTNSELLPLTAIMFFIASVNALHNAVYPPNGLNLFINWFIYYTPYFLMGHILRRAAIQPPKPVLISIFGLSFLATALGFHFAGVKISMTVGSFFYDSMSPALISMAICMVFLFKTWERPICSQGVAQKLASLTMGVYLIHPVSLEVVEQIPKVVDFHPLISIPIVGFSAILVSFAAVWILSQAPYLKRIV